MKITSQLTRRLRWTGQSRAALERQYLTGSFCLYHSFSVIVAYPLSSTLCLNRILLIYRGVTNVTEYSYGIH